VALQIALSVLVPWWIVRRDERRRPPAERARAWNDASFWTAIVAFGPLCIPVHFVRTRRSFWGLILGLFWMAAAVLAILLPIAGLEWLIST
jgi:hypothetical protein